MTRHWRRLLTRGISEVVSIARRAARPRTGLRILMYHALGTRVTNDALGIYNMPPDLFARQIAALCSEPDLRYVSLTSRLAAQDHLSIAITFDDGFRDNLYCAAPILIEHGIPFTVFVCAGFIQENSCTYLSKLNLRELASLKGVTIGSHGATHAKLTGLDAKSLRDELVSSKDSLEQITGRSINSLSYPHGAVNRRVRDAAEEAGYVLGACSRFDINDSSRDPLLLCRTDILGIDSMRVFKQKIRGDWDWYRWRTKDVFTR